MNVERAYNGWSPAIRSTRGESMPRVKRDAPCELCGERCLGGVHAEEYGSTVESYHAHCHPMCPTCHGMLHARFRLPNLWRAYVHDPRGFKRFYSLGAFFASIQDQRDASHVEGRPTGIAWIDALSPARYGGESKIATAMIDGHEVPDPTIYPPGWREMSGLLVREDGSTERVTFRENGGWLF